MPIDINALARWLIIAGLVLAGIGGLLWASSRLGVPLGRLPGDFRFQSNGFTCFFPLASTLLISILLTFIVNLILRLLK
jgi:hypothetical protein